MNAPHSTCYSTFAGKVLRIAFAAALTMGLVPSVAFAAPQDAEAAAVEPFAIDDTAADEAVARLQQTNEQASSQVIEGEALVLYRTQNAGISTFSDDPEAQALQDAAALDEAGFSIEQAWDVSTVDAAQNQGSIATLGLEVEEAASFGASAEEQEALAAASEAATGIPEGSDLRVALVSKEGASAESLVSQLEQLDFVEAAQPNYLIPVSSATPNDPLYEEERYDLGNTEFTAKDGAANVTAGINLNAALNCAKESDPSNIIAVIDGGVDFSNPDLAAVAWEQPVGLENVLPSKTGAHGYNFTLETDDTTSDNSHGTHCAGVVAAAINNGEGTAGASASTKVMGLACSVPKTEGEFVASALISSFQYVIAAKLAQENVVAISNSWSTAYYMPVVDYLVNQAGKAGILSLFAAGNENLDTDQDVLTSTTVRLASPYAVPIAAANEQNEYATFSDYNQTDVDVALPGANILSTVNADDYELFYNPLISKRNGVATPDEATAETEKAFAYYDDLSNAAGGDRQAEYTVRYLAFESGAYKDITDEEGRSDWFNIECVDATETNNNHEKGALSGEAGLHVTLDLGSDGAAQHPNGDFMVQIIHTPTVKDGVTNPLFADATRTGADASHYMTGASIAVDQTSPRSAFVTAQTDVILVSSSDPSKKTIVATAADTATYDNHATAPATLSSLGTDTDSLKTVTYVEFSAAEEAVYSAYVTGVGVGMVSTTGESLGTDAGKYSTYAPYALMSGTSMATPLAAGSVGQLAALSGMASTTAANALELRGMLVGFTEPVNNIATTPDDAGNQKHTATDGRFSWSAAVSGGTLAAETSANPSTWSAEAALNSDGETATVTVYGYNLGDATLAFDGAPVNPTSSANGSITFTVGKDKADGALHRFVVSPPGSDRTHTASYLLSASQSASQAFTEVGALPDLLAGDLQSGALFATATHLFFPVTDSKDAVKDLYTAGVEDTADGLRVAAWKKSEATLETPWDEATDVLDSTAWRLCTLNGKLYAAYSAVQGENNSAGVLEDSPTLRVWIDEYDAEKDAWTGARELYAEQLEGARKDPKVKSNYLAAYNGELYFLVKSSASDNEGAQVLDELLTCTFNPDTNETSATTCSNEAMEGFTLQAAAGTDAGLQALGGKFVAGEAEFALFTYNPDQGAWINNGSFQDAPAITKLANYDNLINGGFVNGSNGLLVLCGQIETESTLHLFSYDTESPTYQSLGNAVCAQDQSLLCATGALRGNSLIVSACAPSSGNGTATAFAASAETTTNESAVRLYAAQADSPLLTSLGGVQRTVSAATAGTGSGSATVQDYRGQAAQSVDTTLNDTVTLKAQAAKGSTFKGWQDETGAQVSTDATFTVPVAGNATYTALFALDASGGGAGDSGTQGNTPDQASGTDDTTASSLIKTGDGIAPFALAALGLAAAAAAAMGITFALRRKRNG